MIQTKTHRKHLFTPLRYPGGKTSLFEYFDNVIKQHSWKDVVYIEPYAGGAGAALSLLLLEKVHSIVINDRDPAIYAFWKSITENSELFINKIETTPLTVAEWKVQKEIYKTADQSDLLKLGFATFFLNRTNRSGILNAGPIGGMTQDGNYKIDARFNKQKMIDKIRLISLYKDRIKVSNADGIDIIKKYSKDERSFFYIDPPYFVKGADLYLNAFKLEDHKKLASVLRARTDVKWLLTYDNEATIRELYSDLEQEPFDLRYSAHLNSRLGSEVMIFSNAIDTRLMKN